MWNVMGGMSKYDNMMVIEGGMPKYDGWWGVGVSQPSKMYDVIYAWSFIVHCKISFKIQHK